MTLLASGTTLWLPGDDQPLLEQPLQVNGLNAVLSTREGVEVATATIEQVGSLTTITVTSYGHARITVTAPTTDAVAVWRPGSNRSHQRLPASWEPSEPATALHHIALGALTAPGDIAAVTFGARPSGERIDMRAGVIEETAELLLTFEVDTDDSFTVFVDQSRLRFADAVQAMTELVVGPAQSLRPVAAVDELPVLSTWYFLHQDINGDALAEYAPVAQSIGFGTLIIDDGWQSTDTDRGYSTAGDWQVSADKLPDPAGLVATFAGRGIRTMWWVGTPFLGDKSGARHSLTTISHDPAMQAGILDPRDPAVRGHLVQQLVGLIESTGSHGLKLDFLERFTGTVPDGVETAAVTLLDELLTALQEVSQDLSIEFREPYFGPAAAERATMIRVNDCPMSPILNRIGIADLRLSTRGIAVHADPIMWAPGDSVSRVAHHLISSLFGVAQISVDLHALSSEHEHTLRNWVQFMNQHRDVLLHGRFLPERAEENYPTMHALRDRVLISARYAPSRVTAPTSDWATWIIANADDELVDLDGGSAQGPFQLTVLDPAGELVSQGRLDSVPTRLRIPSGGSATIQQIAHSGPVSE